MTSEITGQRVLVIGGSIAGLLVGNLLLRAGCDVHVFERASGDLEGRGAGITILPGLVEGFRAAGVEETEESLGIRLSARCALNLAGEVVAERQFAQSMTSWGRLYECLKRAYPQERYHGGMQFERIEQGVGSVSAIFADGQRWTGDLLVGADGLRSAVRAHILPDSKACYAGYLAWRCLADEADLPADMFKDMFERYTVNVAPGQQGIGYPVPGPGHNRNPGHRQFNVVWYHAVHEADELPRFMTDDTGRYHPNGIPPALLSKSIRQHMIATARCVLAPQFATAMERGRVHFFQPIYDLQPEHLALGRVALIGDAGYSIRPHVAMGVPKGAGDAIALLRALRANAGDVHAALADFQWVRQKVGQAILDRARYLGTYMEAQLKSPEERARAEADRLPEQVMMETAAPIDYELA